MSKKKGKKMAGRKRRTGKRGRRQKGSGPVKTIVLIAAVVILSAIVMFAVKKGGVRRPLPPYIERSRDVRLYVPASDGIHLKGIRGKIKRTSANKEVSEALKLLIRRSGRDSAIPEGTKVLGLRVDKDTAYVNFSGKIVSGHGGGSSGEILTVYSIVNTITLNFPSIKKVQILIDGRRKKTLTGHIDISLPLPPDKKMIEG